MSDCVGAGGRTHQDCITLARITWIDRIGEILPQVPDLTIHAANCRLSPGQTNATAKPLLEHALDKIGTVAIRL